MSSDVYSALAVQKGQRALVGGRVFRSALADGLALVAKAADVSKDAHLSPEGRAARVASFVKASSVPALLKFKQQRDHVAQRIAADEKSLKTMALGKAGEHDAEFRQLVRSADPATKARLLTDPDVALAVGRANPILSGIDAKRHEGIVEDMVERNAPAGALQARADAKAGLEFLDAGITALENEIGKAGVDASKIAREINAPALSAFDQSVAELVE